MSVGQVGKVLTLSPCHFIQLFLPSQYSSSQTICNFPVHFLRMRLNPYLVLFFAVCVASAAIEESKQDEPCPGGLVIFCTNYSSIENFNIYC